MSVGTGPGVERDQRRASGKTVADEVADEVAEAMDAPMEDQVLDIERSLLFESMSLHRMQTEWSGQNAVAMDRIRDAVQEAMLDRFIDAYVIMEELYAEVREPVVTEEGEVETDRYGFTVWQRSEVGGYREDWTRLTVDQRGDFLLRITSRLFEWEQLSADLWTEAMFAKAVWTESFSHHFNTIVKGTVDHRTAQGNERSAEDRYFATYLTSLSRKADSLVKSMERLSLRLRDTLG